MSVSGPGIPWEIFVTLGVLFLWDVHLVGMNAHPLLFYSHDEVGWIEA
jgi:hypothetical protein